MKAYLFYLYTKSPKINIQLTWSVISLVFFFFRVQVDSLTTLCHVKESLFSSEEVSKWESILYNKSLGDRTWQTGINILNQFSCNYIYVD